MSPAGAWDELVPALSVIGGIAFPLALLMAALSGRFGRERRRRLPSDLTLDASRTDAGERFSGRADGRPVAATFLHGQPGREDTLTVTIGGLPTTFGLRARGAAEPMGDDVLDAICDVTGDRGAAAVSLSAYVRDRLHALSDHTVSLEHGVLTLTCQVHPDVRIEPARTLELAREVARLVGPAPDDLVLAIRAVALTDRSERWAATAVRELGQRLEGSERTDVLQRVVEQRQGIASLVAAALLGDMVPLLSVVRDPRKAPGARAEALELLVGVAAADQGASAVQHVLDRVSGTGELMRPLPQRAVALLAGPLGATMGSTLRALVDARLHGAEERAWLRDRQTTEHLAEALVTHATASDEPGLLALLEVVHPDAQVILISGLGAVGSARAVPALLALAGEGGDRAAAARAAVTVIQDRVGQGTAGRVSLAGDDARGGLSAARQDARGGLSSS